MFLTNHTLTGTLLALNIDQAVLLAPTAVASHFVLDSLPHFGSDWLGGFHHYRWRTVAAVDSLLSLGVYGTAIMMRPEHFWLITLGVFGATVPDLLYIPRYAFNIKFWEPLFRLHKAVQWSESPPGIISEGVWAAAMLYALR